jgi:hypothetical protein
MTPIQTKFNGRHYRSRVEARYAVLWSACRLAYDHEKEGFWLELGRYLPDFFIPTLDIWFEVKGALPTSIEKDKCHCLADETNRRVVMAYGDPGLETLVGCFSPGWDGIGIQTLPAFLMQWLPPEMVLPAIELAQSGRFEFGEIPNVVPLRLTHQSPRPTTEARPF